MKLEIDLKDTTKLLDISVSTVCLGWSVFLAGKMLRDNATNGLTMALASLLGVIGLFCGWSIWVLTVIKTRPRVVTPHTFLMVLLAMVLDWLHREGSKKDER